MMKNSKLLFLIVLFLVLLIGGRVLWITHFSNTNHPQIVKGELDLRNWELNKKDTLTLDGQWEFYPSLFLVNDDVSQDGSEIKTHYIQVPDGWNQSFTHDGNTPFGYGSYRLRIYVQPNDHQLYSIRIPSIRSSSELFVNGQFLAQSGQPATIAEEYTPKNAPYSATFTANEANVIELVIQVANFKDVRESGIIRSIKFGTDEAVQRETQLSITMQQLLSIIFLIHAVYAFILFIIRNRERTYLYFSLVIFFATFTILLGSEDKLLLNWFPINYEWGFRLTTIALIGVAYFLLLSIRQLMPPFLRLKFLPMYSIFCGIAALSALVLPIPYFISMAMIQALTVPISIVITLVILYKAATKGMYNHILMLLAYLAFLSHFVWWVIFLATGIKVLYYPFDLILAMILFVSTVFTRYFKTFTHTQKLAAKLEKVDKMKDEFLANTSHELRNPLHGILNLTETVLEREQSTLQSKSKQDLDLMLSIGHRMSSMLNDLLDLKRVKENMIQLQLSSVSFPSVVAGVIDMLRYLAEGKAVQLINDIPDHFPAVLADEKRLIQMILNLVHNGIKFTEIGEVSVQAYVKQGKAYISVKDTGKGIDESWVQRIFEPYEQGDDDPIAREGGLGLGLSITKQLVELHGGTLQVNSIPGQGSVFTFDLQLVEPSQSVVHSHDPVDIASSITEPSVLETALPTRLHSEATTVLTVNRPKILAIDDDAINLNILKNILTTEQFEIATATRASEAFELLDSGSWDLIICDVMMPNMSGYEFTRQVRERFSISELPVLLLTARNQEADILTGFQAGANDYVTKPVNPVELRTRVYALTELKRSICERLQMEAAYHQAQIQPHFLFNTLNSIAALSSIDTDRMYNMIESFSTYLRISFDFWNSQQLINIQHEIELVHAYLQIEKERFGDRLSIVWDIDNDIKVLLPPLTIQPLVENAVKHGVLKRLEGVTVQIQIEEHEETVVITIRDNGKGMNQNQLNLVLDPHANHLSGVGLRNLHKRLNQLFGKGLTINSTLNQGTTVSFSIPKITNR